MEKHEINESLAKQLICSQFPQWAHLSIKPVEADGHDNRTFRLGDEMSIRLPTGKAYADHVPIEHDWLPGIAKHLSLPITEPVAKGDPYYGYPWPWSVNRWIPGETASRENIADFATLAEDLADFLNILQKIDATNGPRPGPENYFRGGDLAVYDSETRQCIENLSEVIDSKTATKIWEQALHARCQEIRVWVHGDIAAGNLIVSDGRLRGVIDFGQLAAGDPSCDLAIAWAFFPENARKAFRKRLGTDRSVWIRGRGWALWKALITINSSTAFDCPVAATARKTLDGIFEDYKKPNN